MQNICSICLSPLFEALPYLTHFPVRERVERHNQHPHGRAYSRYPADESLDCGKGLRSLDRIFGIVITEGHEHPEDDCASECSTELLGH